MTHSISSLGRVAVRAASFPWGLAVFFVQATVVLAKQLMGFRFPVRESLNQAYALGVLSLPVIALSLTFVSLMMILEFSFHMKLVLQQDTLVPAFSTLLMLRELGPVVTCLLLASRVGAAIAAELGSMKVTDQIDALRVLSIDPVEYLVIPRWMGCLFACVCLSVVGVAIAIVGGAAMASVRMGNLSSEFFNSMFVFARFQDGVACLIKAAVFGTVLPMVATYQGLNCGRGSAGVGRAATTAVVQSSILIIVTDFIVTYCIYAL